MLASVSSLHCKTVTRYSCASNEAAALALGLYAWRTLQIVMRFVGVGEIVGKGREGAELVGDQGQEAGWNSWRICCQILWPLTGWKSKHGPPQFCIHEIAGTDLRRPTAARCVLSRVRQQTLLSWGDWQLPRGAAILAPPFLQVLGQLRIGCFTPTCCSCKWYVFYIVGYNWPPQLICNHSFTEKGKLSICWMNPGVCEEAPITTLFQREISLFAILSPPLCIVMMSPKA